ncbi:ImmA/IrrE family metallo-endopeptidase [Ligilactobacillus acidipiscis]|uniref:ImmA/IrrE family metallo-endopeptidase n=1 Tax=Ligilactobacillus acidipiscis TaxID=89059 RepID=UPI00070535FA|nr:ImmA/IrrE family metallo-endopeptidase [Ligilactobacillus acidipiscis]GAW63418.1 hypothetical protein Lacidipiscis_00601 [Ligilactobacillus acidipiscis]GEN19625.1 hypothetical protein LAC02_29060 [Ligilactobacillus acidipiscis]
MNRKIRDMLCEYNITIEYSNYLDHDGYYIPGTNIIVLNNRLNEIEQEKTLLHEMTHAALHREDSVLYEMVEGIKQEMENEANKTMIKGMLDEYISRTQLDPSEVNYVSFINDTELNQNYDTYVIKLLKQKINLGGYKNG